MSVKKLKQFDDHIREAFDGYEAPYKPKAWNRLEASLGGKALGGFSSGLKIASAIAVVAASAIGLTYFGSSEVEMSASVESTSALPKAEMESPEPNENTLAIPILEQETSPVELAEEASTAVASSDESASILAASMEPKVAAPAPKIPEPKLPQQLLNLSKNSACLGELIEFNLATDEKVVWEFGDGKVQYGNNVAHRYSKAGVYVAQASILNDEDQPMKVMKSSELKINGIPNPDFEFERPCDNAEASIIFNASNPEIQNIWKLGDGSVLEGAHVEHQYDKMGFFKAKHIVENEFGCKDSVTKRVAVCRAYNLLAPKTFNPSDGGWFPIGLKKGDVSFDLKILDPSAGGLAFQSSNSQDEWDGVVAHSGEKSKSGQNFLWIAVVTDADGKISEYAGDIQIVDNE